MHVSVVENNFVESPVVCIDVERDRVKESSVDAIFKVNVEVNEPERRICLRRQWTRSF